MAAYKSVHPYHERSLGLQPQAPIKNLLLVHLGQPLKYETNNWKET